MFSSTHTVTAPSAGPVQISGAVHVPPTSTRTAARHAPAAARMLAIERTEDAGWLELERVMAARAASMAAHPTAQVHTFRLAS